MTSNQSSNQPDRARFGSFEVDLHTREFWKFGTRLKLVGQPFEILMMLLRRQGELVTREELRDRLWPSDTFVDFNHGLNAAVNKLREALSDSAENPRYVETLPRRGYRFIAAVEWVPAVPAATAIKPAPSAETPTVLPPDLRASPQATFGSRGLAYRPEKEGIVRKARSRYWIGASLAFVFVVLGVLLTASRTAKVISEATGFGHEMPEGSNAGLERTRPLIAAADTSAPAFSPDGNSVAFFREAAKPEESGIFVSAVGSNQFVRLTSGEHDCCPVWSPNGRIVAFSRLSNNQYAIYIVPSDGGEGQKRAAEKAQTARDVSYLLPPAGSGEHKLDTNGIVPRHGELDWSADGKSIAFAGASGIYALSLENSSVRRLTEPPPASDDWGPSYSPNGQKVLFVRNHELGLPDEIWVTSSSGGAASRVLSEQGRIVSAPQWSFDGRSVIFSSNRSGHPALWRASLDVPDSIVQISQAGSPAWDPSISRRGYRLAYERLTRSLGIWQMDLSDSSDKRAHVLVASTSDTDQGPGPQFSPDGEKLAYMSDRAGTMEIWVSNRDGANAFQLTAVGGAGTPRWSPDSQSIVFDANAMNGRKIVSIGLRGGPPQILTPDSFDGACPSWSHDGKWVYFASTHSGRWQVWKIPANGGTPVQVTQQGGHAALESLDGKIIYYAKNEMPEPEIWQAPVEGGAETPLPLVRPGTWASWQVVQGGILFVGPSLGHQAVLSFFDFAKRRTTTITVLDRIPFWLGATPDGRTVAFDQPGREQDQAMLVENFH
jgi:Tol biopolymer transport system component/DNA-binding winged helix-turn-helix (wHTH) protein